MSSNDPKPLVTIGLPVFNAGKTLKAAVTSVLRQSYPNWELVIVDDGSTDASLEIAKSFDDPRIRVVEGSENLGLAFRLNQIAAEARGVYIARLDSDDMMHPERIERQVAFMLANPGVDVVGTGMYLIDNSDKVFGVRFSSNSAKSVAEVLRSGLLLHATIMAAADWFRRNPYDVSLRRSQDRDLWCRTIGTSSFFAIPEPLYFCREAGSVTPREYFRKYLGSRNTRLLLLKRYGPRHLGIVGTIKEVILALAKTEAYRVLAFLRIHAALKLRRVEEMPASAYEEASFMLRQLLGSEKASSEVDSAASMT